MRNDQRMVLAVERRASRQSALEQPLPGVVRVPFRPDAEARERPPSVGIDDEERLPGRVEEDRVRCLRTDAVRGEEERPQFRTRRRQQAAEVAFEALVQQGQERQQLARLAAVEAAGTD